MDQSATSLFPTYISGNFSPHSPFVSVCGGQGVGRRKNMGSSNGLSMSFPAWVPLTVEQCPPLPPAMATDLLKVT